MESKSLRVKQKMEKENAGGILLRVGKMKHVYSGYIVVISFYFKIIIVRYVEYVFEYFLTILSYLFCLQRYFPLEKDFLGKLTICRWVW